MTRKRPGTALDLLARVDATERTLAKHLAHVHDAFAAFGASMGDLSERPRWIMIGHLLDALDQTLADPLVQADPATMAEARALRDALDHLPAKRGQMPGILLGALATPGRQQAGRETGRGRADPARRQMLAQVVAALPNDRSQWPPYPDLVAACVEATGYTRSGAVKALESAHGIVSY